MKKLYSIFLAAVAVAIGCVSCNDEWEDEQYLQMPSFKAQPNAQGVTTTYVRYVPEGTRRYELPVIISGSTMNSSEMTVHVAVDNDTLSSLNYEHYGDREELYFQQMPADYYSFPETVTVPAGECQTVLPIDFKLGGADNQTPLDQADKWVLPLTIVDDESYNYVANPRKWYRKALLRFTPFNDYSGTYAGNQLKITMEGAPSGEGNLQVNEHRSFVVDENTIFFYMGHRDIDYLDRKLYKVFVEFTDEDVEGAQIGAKKLNLWTDNPGDEGNNFAILTEDDNGNPFQAYYTKWEEMDPVKPYMKHIYIILYIRYTFEDYTTAPGVRIKYTVAGSLSMQRDLNTLIPDEDQQIQW